MEDIRGNAIDLVETPRGEAVNNPYANLVGYSQSIEALIVGLKYAHLYHKNRRIVCDSFIVC